jgi:molybdopterin biosynthesis enzyme MoaB
MAALSRAVVGVRGRSLIVNLPGSPSGAIESLDAIADVLPHALETLAGPYDHATHAHRAAASVEPAGKEGPG